MFLGSYPSKTTPKSVPEKRQGGRENSWQITAQGSPGIFKSSVCSPGKILLNHRR